MPNTFWVGWRQDKTCSNFENGNTAVKDKRCRDCHMSAGVNLTEDFSIGFPTPAKALDFAISLRREGKTLLFLEQ